jgi:hypothetical protein
MRQVTKLTKDVRWLEPYLRSASRLVPTHRLKAIRGFTVRAEEDFHFGRILTPDFKSFTMTLALREQVGRRVSPRYIVDILQTFAHELAHLKHWEHTPEHWALEAKIAARFAKVAKRLKLPDMCVKKLPSYSLK